MLWFGGHDAGSGVKNLNFTALEGFPVPAMPMSSMSVNRLSIRRNIHGESLVGGISDKGEEDGSREAHIGCKIEF